MQHDEPEIERAWQLARVSGDRDPRQWRQDDCGAWLLREHYGSGESEFGWRTVHTAPGADPGSLRPFHHANGYDIEHARPRCAVSADRTGLGPEQAADRPHNAAV
jgi:hypothetical protein